MQQIVISETFELRRSGSLEAIKVSESLNEVRQAMVHILCVDGEGGFIIDHCVSVSSACFDIAYSGVWRVYEYDCVGQLIDVVTEKSHSPETLESEVKLSVRAAIAGLPVEQVIYYKMEFERVVGELSRVVEAQVVLNRCGLRLVNWFSNKDRSTTATVLLDLIYEMMVIDRDNAAQSFIEPDAKRFVEQIIEDAAIVDVDYSEVSEVSAFDGLVEELERDFQ
ncbi:hypothetical protein AB4571_02745 [Vibrio breoganii]|nr:hypothetical protein BCT84_12355 [Vibrio breoganii]